MKRIHFSLSIGFPGSHEHVEEFDDDATDEEIDEQYQEWCANYMDGGWWPEKEGRSA